MELWQQVQKEAGSPSPKQEATPLQRLAGLIVQLMENWGKYRFYQTEKGAKLGVPATNNLTEQMIGNGKIRSRTVRGYKSTQGALGSLHGMCCTATAGLVRLTAPLQRTQPPTCFLLH